MRLRRGPSSKCPPGGGAIGVHRPDAARHADEKRAWVPRVRHYVPNPTLDDSQFCAVSRTVAKEPAGSAGSSTRIDAGALQHRCYGTHYGRAYRYRCVIRQRRSMPHRNSTVVPFHTDHCSIVLGCRGLGVVFLADLPDCWMSSSWSA